MNRLQSLQSVEWEALRSLYFSLCVAPPAQDRVTASGGLRRALVSTSTAPPLPCQHHFNASGGWRRSYTTHALPPQSGPDPEEKGSNMLEIARVFIVFTSFVAPRRLSTKYRLVVRRPLRCYITVDRAALAVRCQVRDTPPVMGHCSATQRCWIAFTVTCRVNPAPRPSPTSSLHLSYGCAPGRTAMLTVRFPLHQGSLAVPLHRATPTVPLFLPRAIASKIIHRLKFRH